MLLKNKTTPGCLDRLTDAGVGERHAYTGGFKTLRFARIQWSMPVANSGFQEKGETDRQLRSLSLLPTGHQVSSCFPILLHHGQRDITTSRDVFYAYQVYIFSILLNKSEALTD